jgi:hypothetical protein
MKIQSTLLTALAIVALGASAQARTLSISLVEGKVTIEKRTVSIDSDDEKSISIEGVANCKATTVAVGQSVGIVEISSADGNRSVAIGGTATAGLLDTRVSGRTQTINCAITN